MFAYRLNNPIELEADDGDGLRPPHSLADRQCPARQSRLAPESSPRSGRRGTSRPLGWRMRHLPFADPNAEETTGEPALIVIQQDPGADSLAAPAPQRWWILFRSARRAGSGHLAKVVS